MKKYKPKTEEAWGVFNSHGQLIVVAYCKSDADHRQMARDTVSKIRVPASLFLRKRKA